MNRPWSLTSYLQPHEEIGTVFDPEPALGELIASLLYPVKLFSAISGIIIELPHLSPDKAVHAREPRVVAPGELELPHLMNSLVPYRAYDL